MTCPHDLSEREASVYTEGYCPICMAAEIERLTDALVKQTRELWDEVERLRQYEPSPHPSGK